MRIILIILPWIWIAVSVWILSHLVTRCRRPLRAGVFGLLLSGYGLSCFFIVPGQPATWLLTWQISCVALMSLTLAWPGDRRAGRG